MIKIKKINKIIDLSYPIEEGMLTFDAPWHPSVSIEQLGRHDVEGRETRKISFGTHTGTHLDAPLHFIKKGKSIDEILLDRLIGEVTIVDYSKLKDNEPVTKEMLSKFKIAKKMLFKFGWGRHWGSKEYYANYPFFEAEAAKYLVSKKVELIAMDTPSPDDGRIKLNKDNLGSDRDSPVHKIFLSNEILLVEYLANTEKINDYFGWNIMVIPLKIKGADGSPARVCILK